MADPSLLILLLSVIPVILQSGSLSLVTIVTMQTASMTHLFCCKEPWACFAFLAVLCHLTPRLPTKKTPFLAWIVVIVLVTLFVLLFLGGGFTISLTTARLPRFFMLMAACALVFGILRWAQISLTPLKPDQWLQKGWRLLVPLSALNILITSVRMAFS
jgi:NADH-quinone oxidoreductase subunit H